MSNRMSFNYRFLLPHARQPYVAPVYQLIILDFLSTLNLVFILNLRVSKRHNKQRALFERRFYCRNLRI